MHYHVYECIVNVVSSCNDLATCKKPVLCVLPRVYCICGKYWLPLYLYCRENGRGAVRDVL